MNYWIMTAEDAEDFFKRCIEREAVTLGERLAIMQELMDERGNIENGELNDSDGRIRKALDDGNGIIGIRYDNEDGVDN